MPDLRRLRDIEELVQASVFHPSPCRKLRERVIRDAVKVNRQQTMWRKLIIGSSSVAGSALLLIAILHVFASAPESPRVASPAKETAASRGTAAAVRPEGLSTTGESLGEAQYRARFQTIPASQSVEGNGRSSR